MKRKGTILFSGLMLGACSIAAPRDDFRAYRELRYETSPDRRTALGGEYLRRFPNGAFRDEVRAEVTKREDDFWEEHRSTMEGLQAYLNAFPEGGHAGEAHARIDAFESERRRIAEEQAAAEQRERERQVAEHRAALERQRTFARNTLFFWLKTLGEVDGWGTPISALAQNNQQFSQAFGGQPQPVFRNSRFRKTYHVEFIVPVPGRTALNRSLDMSLDLMVRGDDRRVRQAGLVMHHRGLSSWYECETQGACDPTDPEARGRSVQWAMDQLKGIVATAYPNARETPPELMGPEPEMEGDVENDDPNAVATALPPIPPQPLGVQWSYIVGCGNRGGTQIVAPENTVPPGWVETTGGPGVVRSCLRIDAYSAPDIEGVSTDEGLRISYIPADALAGVRPSRARPARPARPAGPARPARPAGRAAPAGRQH